MSRTAKLLLLLMMVLPPVLASSKDDRSTRQPRHDRTVLLIVDAQVGVLTSIWESKRVIGNLKELVRKARSANVPVIWVQHSNSRNLKFGSENWKLDPEFTPTATEVVIHKKYNSSFAKTSLDRRLKADGVSRIVLAGAATNWCVRSTAYSAVEHGYNLTLVGDAHSTETLNFPDGRTVAALSIVMDLNATFKWMRVPNVDTAVINTADVVF